MNIAEKLNRIARERDKSYWAGRIAAETEYAVRVNTVLEGKYDRDIETALDALLASIASDGVITDAAASFSEKLLLPISSECKKLTLLCIAHAHIDMNWMWGFQETAAVTADTFRTILDLMYEYQDFTFAQSQASVYRIIEEYAPWMLDLIKARVKEGRWEVPASTWVETDKNMPTGESLSRHILNTKQYLSELLEIDPESLEIDFEPDTFGHSANVPEICAAGGIKYYYHCRGHADESLYRWKSPSGANLLVYREPDWYNGEISPGMAAFVPEFCSHYGVDCALKVYGVGDHGGGPTRRDIERALDMMTWPIMPTIKFGTFKEFFKRVEAASPRIPELAGEQNFLFTGCYTSQTRIKLANRLGQARLYDAEQLGAMSYAVGGTDLSKQMTKAWEGVLFNHFHDILPGSGTIETREYAMGLFQNTLAQTATAANYAMQNISDYIDTSGIDMDDDLHSVSEGAGVGYTLDQPSHFGFPKAERGRGKTRIFVLYNTTAYDRNGSVELTVWDWPGEISRMRVKSASGKDTRIQLSERGNHYWGHKYQKILIDASVPALGYSTYVLYEAEASLSKISVTHKDDRRDYISDDNIVLENSHVRAEFKRSSMRVISLVDLKTKTELVDSANPSCGFNYIVEDSRHGMTSWRVGERMLKQDLNTKYPVRLEYVNKGEVLSFLKYSIEFENSKLEVVAKLGIHSKTLEFDVHCDWHEVGNREKGIPQLSFCVPFKYAASKFVNDIPMGITERKPMGHDVPCVSFSAPVNENGPSMLLTSDTKYGFRNSKSRVELTLIRSSYDPDPYPEYGEHNIRLGLALVQGQSSHQMAEQANVFEHPVIYTSARKHFGKLPLKMSFARLEGENILLSTIKTAEDGSGNTVLRVYNAGRNTQRAKIEFYRRPKSVSLTDTTEMKSVPIVISGNGAEFDLPACAIATLKVDL